MRAREMLIFYLTIELVAFILLAFVLDVQKTLVSDRIGWFSVFAEVSGFTGLFLGEISIFFMSREAEEARKPRLVIEGIDRHGDQIRIAIKNSGGSVARGCYGKITIEHTEDDVVNVGIPTFILRDYYTQVKNMNLSWAFAGNPPKIDIPKGGTSEMLMIARLQTYAILDESVKVFNIPSELGYGDIHHIGERSKGMSRVTLVARKYIGKLMIGADDIEPIERNFEVLEKDGVPYLQLGA